MVASDILVTKVRLAISAYKCRPCHPFRTCKFSFATAVLEIRKCWKPLLLYSRHSCHSLCLRVIYMHMCMCALCICISLSYHEEMQEIMRVLIQVRTQAGPGTIAEATVVGLPIMLSGFLPGQVRIVVFGVHRACLFHIKTCGHVLFLLQKRALHTVCVSDLEQNEK